MNDGREEYSSEVGNFCYADDTFLFGNTEEKIAEFFLKVNETTSEVGLQINALKSKTTVTVGSTERHPFHFRNCWRN